LSGSTRRASNAPRTAATDSFVGITAKCSPVFRKLLGGAGERVCFAKLAARNRSDLRAKAVLLPRSASALLQRHQQQWCGGKGLLRKAWRAKSQRLARESSSAPTLCLGAFTASPTTVVRGNGSASQRLAREIAAPCARKQFCSHALP